MASGIEYFVDFLFFRIYHYRYAFFPQFISELIETAKYCNHEKVEMFVMMLHNTLPLAVGSVDAIINKHIAAIGTRFK